MKQVFTCKFHKIAFSLFKMFNNLLKMNYVYFKTFSHQFVALNLKVCKLILVITYFNTFWQL